MLFFFLLLFFECPLLSTAHTNAHTQTGQSSSQGNGKHSPSARGTGAGGDTLSIPLVSVTLLALFSQN